MPLNFNVRETFSRTLLRSAPSAASRASHILAVQIEGDTRKYVPASGAPAGMMNRTIIDHSTIIYPGPYARYLYNGKVMVNAATGKGPMHYVDKGGNEVIRFPKGSRLKTTDRNLVFSKSVNPEAQAHWFEASKAQNLQKWVRVAGRAFTREIHR